MHTRGQRGVSLPPSSRRNAKKLSFKNAIKSSDPANLTFGRKIAFKKCNKIKWPRISAKKLSYKNAIKMSLPRACPCMGAQLRAHVQNTSDQGWGIGYSLLDYHLLDPERTEFSTLPWKCGSWVVRFQQRTQDFFGRWYLCQNFGNHGVVGSHPISRPTILTCYDKLAL